MVIGRDYANYYLRYDTEMNACGSTDISAFFHRVKTSEGTRLYSIEGRDRKKYLGEIAAKEGLSFDTSWQFKRIVKFLIDELDKKYGTNGNAAVGYYVVKYSSGTTRVSDTPSANPAPAPSANPAPAPEAVASPVETQPSAPAPQQESVSWFKRLLAKIFK